MGPYSEEEIEAIYDRLDKKLKETPYGYFLPDSDEVDALKKVCLLKGDGPAITFQLFKDMKRGTGQYKNMQNVVDYLHNNHFLHRYWPERESCPVAYYFSKHLEDWLGIIPASEQNISPYLLEVIIPRSSEDNPSVGDSPQFSGAFSLDDMIHVPAGQTLIFRGYIRSDGSLEVTIALPQIFSRK